MRSSLVGRRPPRAHGMTTRVSAIAVVITSITRKPPEPVAFATPRTRRADSTFAAMRARLSTRKTMRAQMGSRVTRASEIDSERDREDDERDPGAGAEIWLEHVTLSIQPAQTRLHVEEHTHEEQADQGRGHLGHVQEERV